MVKSKIIIANWKMNGNNKLIDDYNDFTTNCKYLKDNKLIVCPPNIFLTRLKNQIIGAQDCSKHSGLGSYTGEISADLLADINVQYSIIGHSERRDFEDNKVIKAKLENCLSTSITPILCVGETKEERDNNSIYETLSAQLMALKGLDINQHNLIIAYEPRWSIGSNITPTVTEIQDILAFIRNFCSKKLLYNNYILAYGGSVNPDFALNLSKIIELRALLVGKNSLNIIELEKIMNNFF